MSKESFTLFVRNYPELSRSVLSNKTTWQQLYELYDMYGEDSSVWDKYIFKSSDTVSKASDSSLNELINMIKKVDLNSVQKGVNNIQKTIGLLQDIGIGSSKSEEVYEPRPLYQKFDD